MEENKKIGIVTYYYDSINYGGVLQAYALTQKIDSLGYNVEQICYKKENDDKVSNKKYLYLIKKFIKKIIILWCYLKMSRRYNRFKKFRDEIPHSMNVYTDNNIENTIKDYDIFVTGSDQVWNLTWFCPAFFLEFVSKNKKKLSYAASLGRMVLAEEEKNFFKKVLVNYSAISVREKDAVELLKNQTSLKIEHVLDPTLLLKKEEWDKISNEYTIEKPYLFCYFIGEDRVIRKLAKKYAKKYNLKLVVLPHPAGFNFTDINFGDIKTFDAGPKEFISLIKNADYIMTDSFHACVFSTIYQKEFFAFQRNGKKEMSSRIYSLLNLFEAENHFCDMENKLNIKYIENLERIDYTKDKNKFDKIYKKSIDYLISNLSN